MTNWTKVLAVLLVVACAGYAQASIIPADGTVIMGFENTDKESYISVAESVGYPSIYMGVGGYTQHTEGLNCAKFGGRDGGTNPAHVYIQVDFDQSYDLYAGGYGELTYQVMRYTGPLYRQKIDLIDSNGVTVASSAMVDLEDNAWHTFSVDIDENCTDVAGMKVYFSRIGTDTSALYLMYDNVLFSVPEPATISLIGFGGLVALLKRKRA